MRHSQQVQVVITQQTHSGIAQTAQLFQHAQGIRPAIDQIPSTYILSREGEKPAFATNAPAGGNSPANRQRDRSWYGFCFALDG